MIEGIVMIKVVNYVCDLCGEQMFSNSSTFRICKSDTNFEIKVTLRGGGGDICERCQEKIVVDVADSIKSNAGS